MSKSSVQPWAFNEHQHDLADKLLVQSWWRAVLRVIVACKIQTGRSKRTGVRIVDHGVGNVTSPRYGYPFLLWSSFSSVLLRVSRSRKLVCYCSRTFLCPCVCFCIQAHRTVLEREPSLSPSFPVVEYGQISQDQPVNKSVTTDESY